jgi:Flp pilus assembly protein CpaB
VVRAAADNAPTIEIGQSMVTKSTVPKTLLPDGVFSDPAKLVGRVTSQMIPKGMPITASLLAPEGTPPGMVAKIPDGYRAVAISVDEIVGVGGFVKPGARVDVVIVMSGQGRNQNISRVILQNVEVLAVGQKTETSGQSATVSRSVTVLVKPEDASKLSLASQKGKLRLALRSQEDFREPKPVTLTDEDLLSDSSSARRRGKTNDSLLGMLFGDLQKKAEPQDDVKARPEGAPTPPSQKVWEIEVLSGSEAYKVKFDEEGNSTVQESGEAHPAGKTNTSPKSNAVAPTRIQPARTDSTPTARPNAGGIEADEAEQVKMLEALEARGE